MVVGLDGALPVHGQRVLTSRWLLVAGLLIGSCGRGGEAALPAAGTALGVRDSVRPRQVELERFRATTDRVTGLAGGALTRDALVLGFIRAVEAGNAAAAQSLALSRAEFGWLYYPGNPFGRPPYDLSPELFWFTLDTNGRKGRDRVLRRLGGRPLGYRDYHCPAAPGIEGENRIHAPCEVTFEDDGELVTARHFGPIIERDGRFKFVNLAAKVD